MFLHLLVCICCRPSSGRVSIDRDNFEELRKWIIESFWVREQDWVFGIPSFGYPGIWDFRNPEFWILKFQILGIRFPSFRISEVQELEFWNLESRNPSFGFLTPESRKCRKIGFFGKTAKKVDFSGFSGFPPKKPVFGVFRLGGQKKGFFTVILSPASPLRPN